jgi:diguanylate cyclase (GGDEF)-like protein
MLCLEWNHDNYFGLDFAMPNLQPVLAGSPTFSRKESHRLLGEEQAALANRVFLTGWRGLLLPVAGLALIGQIALLDSLIGPKMSFAMLYLVPIALGAWWGGFAQGILLSMACAISWQFVEVAEGPDAGWAIHLWNGITRFGVFVIASSLLSRLRVALYVEKKMARSDPLTGAANGRTFYETVSQYVEYALQGNRPITLAYLDLDQFKRINDQFGHAAGDEVLCNLVQVAQEEIRVVDLFARLGGDEFALLLIDCDETAARAILERVRERFAQEMMAKKWPVTASVGAVTFLHPVRDVDAMVRQVDELMYRAKEAGKNCIVHESMLPEETESENSKVVERRATARVVCDRLARISSRDERECHDEFARVRDISATGLGLVLERMMPENTLLAIDPLHECGTATLLARVMWSVEENGEWLHECALPNRLSAEHLQFWVEERTAESCR